MDDHPHILGSLVERRVLFLEDVQPLLDQVKQFLLVLVQLLVLKQVILVQLRRKLDLLFLAQSSSPLLLAAWHSAAIRKPITAPAAKAGIRNHAEIIKAPHKESLAGRETEALLFFLFLLVARRALNHRHDQTDRMAYTL
jgi:hypothetical protein